MKLLVILTAIMPLVFFASCASQPKLQDNAPVAIDEYYYQTWAAGARGAGSGINFTLALKQVPTNVVLKDLYFQGRKTALKQGEQAPSVFTGYFKTDMNDASDLQMNADSKKEYGNAAPQIENEDIPFELKDTEAVISYEVQGKLKYYKLIEVAKRPTKQMPM